MRIYLDSCSLQRPLDDQTQPRIRVETEAIIAILATVQAGDIALLNSEALEYETGRIPDAQRQRETEAILSLASEYIKITNEAEILAGTLETQGVQAMDAVHLALASTTKADYFVTCDDKFLRKASTIPNLGCQVISVLSLVVEVLK